MAKAPQAAQAGETVLESKAVVVRDSGAQAVMVEGQKFEIVRRVNVPTLKQETGETVTFKIIQPLEDKVNYETKEMTVDGVKKMVTEEKRITIARVIPIGSEDEFEYVCNAMTSDNLRSTYPNHDYVGRFFAVQKRGVVQGKRYKEVEIVEIKPAA